MQGNYMLTRVVDNPEDVQKKLLRAKGEKVEIEGEIRTYNLEKELLGDQLNVCIDKAENEIERENCTAEYNARVKSLNKDIAEANARLGEVNAVITSLEQDLQGEETLIPVDNVFMIEKSCNTEFIEDDRKAICLQYKEFNSNQSLGEEQTAPRFVACFIEVADYLGNDNQLLTDVAESVMNTVKAPNSQPELKFRYAGAIVSRVVEPYFGN